MPPYLGAEHLRSALGRSYVLSRGLFEDSEEFTGDVALEAAADVAVGFSLGAAAFGVGLGSFVASQTGDGDGVDCRVESTVTEAVQAMSSREADDAGIGAVPASIANAASLRTRPG